MGGAAGNYGFQTTGSATEFATTLWNKFGAGEDDERPFDDAIIDGFDFDIELPNEDGKSVGYPELATALRSKFSEDSSKQYYLSAAPQCPYPDALLKDLMNQVPLDFAFIQFYNNECSIDQEFNYDTWQTFAETAPNSDIQLFVGVPATSNIAGYVDAEQLSTAIDQIKCDANFAGVSLWDASGAWSNVNDEGENFAAQVKKVLNDNVCEAPSSSSVEEESTSTAEEESTTEEPTEEPTVESTTLPSSTAHYYGNSTVSSTQSSTKVSSSSSTVVSSSATKAPGSGNGLITVTDIHKTVVTVTSCSENKCHATPVTTGYVVVTDLHTVYTTYCPLTNSEVVVPVKSTTIRSTSISTVPCTTSTGTQEGNKDVEHQKEQPETTSAPAVIVSSSSGVVVSSTVVPAGEESGETVYSTIEITSTIVPYPVPTTVTYSSNNGTQPAGNGTVPVFTYEGAGVVNTINNAWYTLPLLLVALAF
ncbi:Chitinase 2 [Candida tropicalis]